MARQHEKKHTVEELRELQALPLRLKIMLTKARIRDWIDEFGEDGVYVSFSGGKDSTVLLDLVRQDYPNVQAAFVDTGLEYPEIREFVKGFDNVDWIKPRMTFRQVIDEFGYPMLSKEISRDVGWVQTRGRFNRRKEGDNWAYKSLMGLHENPMQNKKRYAFLLDAPFKLSNQCCRVMKKEPLTRYERKSGRKPFIGVLAEESMQRKWQWIQNGCNSFDGKKPSSKPMSFWLEQDVLHYIKQNNIRVADAYGELVEDDSEQADGQLTLFPLEAEQERKLRFTGCDRTGCIFCGFGCHIEKCVPRFVRLRNSHPTQYKYIMKPWDEGGLGYKDVIDWMNEHGNLHIKY